MQKTHRAAAFALLLFLVSSTPVFAAGDRARAKTPDRDLTPIERVIQIIRNILVKPLDTPIIPRP